ncbi:MAG: hypothetical protein JWM16_4246 [Verrucomicrobiales bacterium]|nr:hypothetical protein [Verrucomicrobiales bacterium]
MILEWIRARQEPCPTGRRGFREAEFNIMRRMWKVVVLTLLVVTLCGAIGWALRSAKTAVMASQTPVRKGLAILAKASELNARLEVLVKDEATGKLIANSSMKVYDEQEYPLLGKISKLPDALRKRNRIRQVHASGGMFIFDAPTYGQSDRWGSIKLRGEAVGYHANEADFPMNWGAVTTNHYVVLLGKEKAQKE